MAAVAFDHLSSRSNTPHRCTGPIGFFTCVLCYVRLAYAGRNKGVQPLPLAADPPSAADVSSRACDVCGQISWDVSSPVVEESTVFLLGAFTQISFLSFACNTAAGPGGRRCKGRLRVDGQALGLLRQTPTVAFGLCLLYVWWAEMKEGGVAWWRFWRRILSGYWRYSSVLCIADVKLYFTDLVAPASSQCVL